MWESSRGFGKLVCKNVDWRGLATDCKGVLLGWETRVWTAAAANSGKPGWVQSLWLNKAEKTFLCLFI